MQASIGENLLLLVLWC